MYSYFFITNIHHLLYDWQLIKNSCQFERSSTLNKEYCTHLNMASVTLTFLLLMLILLYVMSLLKFIGEVGGVNSEKMWKGFKWIDIPREGWIILFGGGGG